MQNIPLLFHSYFPSYPFSLFLLPPPASFLELTKNKYESLEKEQSDLVQCLTNTEMENINLKERIKILEGSN
jgi:hypothetical protein